MESRAKDFGQFCTFMTKFAENQMDLHRSKYYKISKETYRRIMKCYEQPRKTNEETDACASTHRKSMELLQSELTKELMKES